MQVLRGSHSSHQLSKLEWLENAGIPSNLLLELVRNIQEHPSSHIIAVTSSLTCSGQWNSFSCHVSRLSTLIPCTPLPPFLDTLSLVEGIGAQNPGLQPPCSHHGDTEDMSSVIGPCGCVSWYLSLQRFHHPPGVPDSHDSTSIWPSSNSARKQSGIRRHSHVSIVSRDSGARQQSFPSGYTHLRFFGSGWHRGRPQPPPARFESRKDVLISEFMSYRGAA